MALHTFVVGLTGSVVTAGLVRTARRHAVADRLRSHVVSRRVLPGVVRVPLARALHDAAFASTPERAVEVWSLVCGIAVVVGLGLAPAAGVCAGGVVIVGGPAFLRSAGQRRARLVAAEVPVTLERVGAELRVGGTVAGAVATLAAGDGPLAPDMQRVETRIRLGSPLSGALRAWARERRVAGVEAAAGALALSATVGGRAADSLDGLASSLRDRLAVAAEARALSAQARYSAWVIGIAPAGYIVVSAVVDPRSLHALLGTDAGRACALAGVVLESAGAAWMRAIVRAGEMA